ncbi:MAG: hypothetical protein BJ554DRAFT_4268 [Olpidium bornovanus]|uniref:Uncharacterized protein n=1 Tax=Olpidium bornovanus TaxID=278681 RepID=A0A8H7ZMC3_9FUNG|nr:MAG: hypothetical protein BJ554DRAFT_4268 [Olpidium bornovanus]
MLSVPNILERISLRPGWDATLRGYTSNSYPSVAAVDSVRTEEAEKLQRTVKTLYSEEDLAKSGPNEEEGGSQRFEALKSVLLELLLSTLRADASPRNTRYLLHLLNVYVVEEVSHCPAVVGVVIGVVRDKILALSASCPEVCMTAFCLLADFVDLYDYVMRESKVTRESFRFRGSNTQARSAPSLFSAQALRQGPGHILVRLCQRPAATQPRGAPVAARYCGDGMHPAVGDRRQLDPERRGLPKRRPPDALPRNMHKRAPRKRGGAAGRGGEEEA